MSKETIYYRDVISGTLIPVDKLTSESKFEFDVIKNVKGGKIAFTEAEKILMHGEKPKRGAAHGKNRFNSLGDMGKAIYLPMYRKAIADALRQVDSLIEELSKK